MRRLSNVADSKVELLVQFFQVPADQISHLHMLQMLPSPFVSRVQIGTYPGRASSHTLPRVF